ncbi:MAG: hypothetical protein WC824_04270 [Bacteroidota bacterium]
MYRFYRMDKDEQENDILHIVDTCVVQGDHVPSVPEKYHHILFHLGIDADDRIFVRREYSIGVPEDVMNDVEEWLNAAQHKKALPTYFHSFFMFNGVERMPHLRLVYIAESEEEVWDFVNK